jgi:hypothetical protein
LKILVTNQTVASVSLNLLKVLLIKIRTMPKYVSSRLFLPASKLQYWSAQIIGLPENNLQEKPMIS